MESSGTQGSAAWLGTQGGAFVLDEDSLFRYTVLCLAARMWGLQCACFLTAICKPRRMAANL